jgi:hypothetical protein
MRPDQEGIKHRLPVPWPGATLGLRRRSFKSRPRRIHLQANTLVNVLLEIQTRHSCLSHDLGGALTPRR